MANHVSDEEKVAFSEVELPAAGFLSNGRYTVVVSGDGGGHSAYGGRLLSPRLGSGTRLYVSDGGSAAWKLGPSDRGADPDFASALGPGAFQMRREEGLLTATADACVVPDLDAELRRYAIANASDERRTVTITLVTDVDRGRPVFEAGREGSREDRAAVTTRVLGDSFGVMARIEGEGDQPLCWLHTLVSPNLRADGHGTGTVRFFAASDDLGPDVLPRGLADEPASGDPILAVQAEFTLEPGGKQSFVLAGCAASSMEIARETAGILSDSSKLADAFLEAALREQQARDRLKIGPRNADRYHRLAAAILRGDPALRPDRFKIEESGREAAQHLNINQERPLLVCRVADESELHIARLTLKASAFWRTIGLDVQLLFLNDKSGPQADRLQRSLHDLIEHAAGAKEHAELRHADAISPQDQRAIQNAARFVVTGERIGLLRVKP